MFHANITYDIMYDIIQRAMISCIISLSSLSCATLILSKSCQYTRYGADMISYFVHDIIYDMIFRWFSSRSCAFFCYDIAYEIISNHMKSPTISESHDINYDFAYDMAL
jgi:hypothetical protein